MDHLKTVEYFTADACRGCYGNGLSWYLATNTDFVQCFNLIKNQMQVLRKEVSLILKQHW